MKRVLCVAAHPDDEALGCGGALAKHSLAGDEVHLIFMADGVTSRRNSAPSDVFEREEMAGKAAACFGVPFERVHFLDFPDQRMDSGPFLYIVQALEKVTDAIGPVDIVYTHHARDLNQDHRLTHDAVMTTFRPKPGCMVSAIRCFEVPSATDWAFDQSRAFFPNLFIDISGFAVERKLEAIACYRSEIPAFPHARSSMAIDALMRWRGATVGLQCAEAFITAREVIR